jgi:hypothetical protein
MDESNNDIEKVMFHNLTMTIATMHWAKKCTSSSHSFLCTEWRSLAPCVTLSIGLHQLATYSLFKINLIVLIIHD